MKHASAIMVAGAVAVGTVVVLASRHSSSQHGTQLASSGSVSSSKPAVATGPLKKVSPAPKPVDVYFLSEATGSNPGNEKSKTMRQPVVNGNRRMDPGQAVTTKAEGDYISPRWSPDGLQLLFSKPGFDGLYARGLSGGPITQITDRQNVGFKAKWNENGQIESKTNSGEKQTFNPDGSPADTLAIENDDSIVGTYTKDDTVYLRQNPGEPARPVSIGNDRFYGGVVSPDGKYIVYNGLQTGLYIQPVDGSAPPTSLGEGYSPSWLPDSSGIVYNISTDDGHNITGSDLFLASVDGNNVSNLTQSSNESEMNPSVSPDGTHIAYEVDGVVYVGTLH